MNEKRQYPRKRVSLSALFKGGKLALKRAQVRDISRSGIFILVDTPPEADEIVIVNLDSYEIGKDLSMKCRVVRSIPENGMGLEITTTTDDEHLREWLAK